MNRSGLMAGLAGILLVLWLAPAQPQTQQPSDPLPSWNAGPNKQAILDFVKATTDKASPKFVPVAERIATFDNDGTLWVEQPIYTEFAFAFDRLKTLAPKNEEWKTKEPFKAVLTDNREAMAKFSRLDYGLILGVTHGGMTVDQFRTITTDWLATAKHPRYKKLYTECVYQPMLEVMRYLRANGFKTYIVTGGGQEFVRMFSEKVYGIPPEQVIGTVWKLKYGYQDGKPTLNRQPALLMLNDEEGKPEDIEIFIGRKPLAAFGNSDGDRQMLEWTQSGGGQRLMMLVHHDDAEREYAYGAKSKVGTFSDSLMAEAKKQKWNVISMKNDWKRIFPVDMQDAGLSRELVGKWLVVDTDLEGAIFDISADGVMTGKVKINRKEGIIHATLRVEDKTIYSTTKHPQTGEAHTAPLIIRSVTDRELVIESSQGTLMKMERIK